MALSPRDRRVYSPVNACVRLRARADALETDVFDADIVQLRWLADRMVERERDLAQGGEGEGLAGFTREFGLQLRTTAKAMGELEAERRVAAEAATGAGLGDREWRMRIVEGGQAGAVSAVS